MMGTSKQDPERNCCITIMEYWVNYKAIRLLGFQDKKLVRWEVSACQCRRCGSIPDLGRPHTPQWEVQPPQLDSKRPSPPPLAAAREKLEDSAQFKKQKTKNTHFKICYKASTNKTLKTKKKTEPQIQSYSLQKASWGAFLSLLFPAMWESPGSLYCILNGPNIFFLFLTF